MFLLYTLIASRPLLSTEYHKAKKAIIIEENDKNTVRIELIFEIIADIISLNDMLSTLLNEPQNRHYVHLVTFSSVGDYYQKPLIDSKGTS